MELVRKELSAVEGQAPGQRYNPDCDCIEVTVNGGVTWTEDPSADPRTNIVYLLPPNEAPDPKCASAAGMVAYVRQSVDTAIDAATVIGLANGIFAIIVAFLPITILAAVVIAVAEYLVGLVAAALIAAFTEQTYEPLLCIFLEHVEADGTITEAGFTAAQAQIASEIGDIVVDGVISALYSSTGFVGWSNAGAALADPEEECPCGWCELIDFRTGAHGFVAVELDFGVEGALIPGVGWQPTVSDGGSCDATGINIYYNFAGLLVDSIEVYYENVFAGDFTSAPAGAWTALIANTGGGSADLTPPFENFILQLENLSLDDFYALIRSGYCCNDCGDPGGAATIPQIVIRGQGEPPGIGVPC